MAAMAPPRRATHDAPLPDGTLVARALGGDEHAFAELFRRHARDVARTAHALLRQDDEVDDVVQRAFAEACLTLSTLREPDRFGAWLRRIAVRDAVDLLRARRRRQWVERAFALLAPRTQRSSDGTTLSRLYDVLDALPVDLRAAWTLHRLDGHTFEEVARLCNVSLNTAKRRVAAAEGRIQRGLHA